MIRKMGISFSSCFFNMLSKIYLFTGKLTNHVTIFPTTSTFPAELYVNKENKSPQKIHFEYGQRNLLIKYKKENGEHSTFTRTLLNTQKITELKRKKTIKPKKFPRYGNEQKRVINEVINVPVVLTNSVLLRQLGHQSINLPLGTVLNVIFRKDNWLYVQTAHGEEGYVDHRLCMPLEISSSLTKTCHPASVSNNEIIFFDVLHKLTKINNEFHDADEISCSERNIDILYCQATSSNQKQYNNLAFQVEKNNSILLIITHDYYSNGQNMLTVKKGDVVFLVHCLIKGWFWVKSENEMEGFIPSIIASYRFSQNF